jgi:DNA-binding MarR family transcriptional regulator
MSPGTTTAGVPAAGVPAAGVPAAGVPAAGVPAAGVPANRAATAGVPADGAGPAPLGKTAPIDNASLADELGATLVQLYTLMRRNILPLQIGLTQASTLLILRDSGPQRVTSLADAALVAQPTMSAVIIGMERLGWVRRDGHRTDRRAVVVCLTEEGENVVCELEAARSRALLADIETLPTKDLAALVAALPALRGIIAEEQQSKAVTW